MRQASPGQPNPVIEIPLRDGVVTNETGFAIGPRLRLAQNVAWQNFHATDPLRRRSMGFLAQAPGSALRELADGTHAAATHLLGAKFVVGSQGVIVAEEFDTGHLLVHREVTGALIVDTGNALMQTPDPKSAALAFWGGIETPSMFITHPGLTYPETYRWDGVTFVPYTPTNVPGLPSSVDAAVNPAVTAQGTTGSEVALPAGVYQVILVGYGSTPHTSATFPVTIAAGQVIRIITAPIMAGISYYDIFVSAADQLASEATLQLTGATAATAYRVDTSGTPTVNTPIPFTTTGVAMPSIFKGNTALIVHLDRLWLAKVQSTSDWTFIWYTDPFDPDTIRPTNSVGIPDVVTALFRSSASPIDIGASAHLLFGAYNSIWVLDGDPTTQGPNTVLRRLTFGVGIADSSLVCETLFGAVILATDGQFYLIPPGGQELVPIGAANHDQAALYRTTAFSGVGAHASLAWASPYVYYCPNDLNAVWVLDFSHGAPPKWWGPLTHAAGTLPARVWSIGPEDGFSGATKINAGTSSIAEAPGLLYQIDLTAVVLTDRTAKLRTGYFAVPGHRVQLMRCVLTTTQRDDFVTPITVTAFRADGTSEASPTVTIKARTGTAAQDRTIKTVFAWNNVVSDYVYLELEWDAEFEPDLQAAWVEVKPQPRQDQ